MPAPDLFATPSAAPVPATFSPLYQQIKALMLRGMAQGEWKPGEMIPSELELAARFKVSQGTVRKAIDELAQEHLLTRKQGKGTFVATHGEARIQFRFLRLTPNDGAQSQPESTIIDCKRQRAPADVARALEFKVGDTAITIRRLLSFQGEPAVLDDLWLPGTLFKGLTAERLVSAQVPLYSLFEQDFGIKMLRAEEKIRAVAAPADVAAILRVVEGAPLLLVERLSFTYGDKPVELRRGHYLTEKYFYRNVLG